MRMIRRYGTKTGTVCIGLFMDLLGDGNYFHRNTASQGSNFR